MAGDGHAKVFCLGRLNDTFALLPSDTRSLPGLPHSLVCKQKAYVPMRGNVRLAELYNAFSTEA